MAESNEYEARTARSAVRFILWVLAWVGTMVLVDKAVLYGWYDSAYISVLGIIANAALGVGAIMAFLRHLRGMDEMQRKIQLDSLAFSMGIVFVGSFTYSLLVTTGFVTDAEVSDLILLAAFAYMASLAIRQFRYR